VTDTSRSEVENYKPQSGLTDAEKDALVSTANRFVDDVYSGLVRTLSQVEGDEKDFKSFIAAHLWTLAEGGELQSEGQAGGSVSYNVQPGGDNQEWLAQTRYGKMALGYIRDDAQVGVEWA
jgi:hypothetical protein